MQYNKRTSYDIEDNFLLNLFIDRGVLPTDPQEVSKFTNPTIDNEYNPELLDHMEEGF